MRRGRLARIAIIVVLFLGTLAPGAGAAEWGEIVPGTTTLEAVRERYGPPTRSQVQKVEGYDSTEWIYEGAQAPTGARKLSINLGLLTPSGFRKNVVRDFRLEPKPGVFRRLTVLAGWGVPDRVGRDGETEIFFYQEGLLVYFDRDGADAQLMVFTPPQPTLPEPAPSKP